MAKKKAIIVSHLSKKVTEGFLKDVFTSIGHVKSAKFIEGKHKKAIVEFSKKESVKHAIKELNKVNFIDKRVKIKKYKSKNHSRHRSDRSKENDQPKADYASRESSRHHSSRNDNHHDSSHHKSRNYSSRDRHYKSNDSRHDINNNSRSSRDRRIPNSEHETHRSDNRNDTHRDHSYHQNNGQISSISNQQTSFNRDKRPSRDYEKHTSRSIDMGAKINGSRSFGDKEAPSSKQETSETENNKNSRRYSSNEYNDRTSNYSKSESYDLKTNGRRSVGDKEIPSSKSGTHYPETDNRQNFSNEYNTRNPSNLYQQNSFNRDRRPSREYENRTSRSFDMGSKINDSRFFDDKETPSSNRETSKTENNNNSRRYSSNEYNASNYSNSKSDSRDLKVNGSKSSNELQLTASKPDQSNNNKAAFKYDDADRTFPKKLRFKLGKKALKKILFSGKSYPDEKKWPSTEFIENSVKRYRYRFPQEGRVLGGYYRQSAPANGKKT